LINRLPISSLKFEIPYHALFQKLLDYSFLKTFGCSCFLLGMISGCTLTMINLYRFIIEGRKGSIYDIKGQILVTDWALFL